MTDCNRSAFCVAASQFSCSKDREDNIRKAEEVVREAAGKGCHLVLIQELFASVYFCQDESPSHFDLALPASLKDNDLLARMSALAKELRIILPVSFFEKRNHVYFNSVVVFDADGTPLGVPPGGDILDGVYRKVHIPTGPGYEEKYYFSPAPREGGGFRVYYSRVFHVTIGVAICWDQWFPETSRIMALMGAEVLLFPTAIGSEPQDPSIHSRDHWQRAMCGHAASNLVPLVASNRIGKENQIRFYGSSFISDFTGEKVKEADEESRTVLFHRFDLNEIALARSSWGLFRDRRPELYGPLTSLDGRRVDSVVSSIGGTGFYMPGEWYVHSRCWMLWIPSDTSIWSQDILQQARKEFAAVAKAINDHENVTMCCLESERELVRSFVGEEITVVPISYEDCWARDTAPTFVINNLTKEVGGIDWIFDGYSNKFPHDKDKHIAKTILSMQGLKRFACPLTLEGGSIHVDGEGTLLTTEECLLKRNSHLTKSDIELQLQMFLGISKVIWLPKGVKYDVDTDGHVDNICCFARPGEVILTYPSSVECFQRKRSDLAKTVLESTRDARGRSLKVHLLEHPKPIVIEEAEASELRPAGTYLAASYVNFYMANGAIIMPYFENGEGLDKVAQKQLEQIFPQRVVKGVSSAYILRGGGNIHCITQQQPK